MVNMGQRLKQLRTQKNLTQKQVAERVGLAVSAISSYESGFRYPSYPTLVKLASMYHVSCDLMSSLANHIASHHHFKLDPRETTLVGVCARCTGTQEETLHHGSDHSEECHDCL